MKNMRATKAIRIFTAVITIVAALRHAPTVLASGSYTSAGSRALADTNAAGDHFIAGDNKIFMSRDSFSSARTLVKAFAGTPSVVTGALLARSNGDPQDTRVRLCSQTHAYLMSLTTHGVFRSSETDLTDSLQLKGARDLRCAVDRSSGAWIAINVNQGFGLIFPDSQDQRTTGLSFTLPKSSGRWSHVIATPAGFVVFAENGVAALVRPDMPKNSIPQWIKSPWSGLDHHDTLSMNGEFLLRAGEGQVSLTRFSMQNTDISWGPSSRIGISPCSETGGCGAWVSSQGQWIVAGTWGTYVGHEQQFARLKTPLVMTDATSPGVALLTPRGEYLLVGDVEAEKGSVSAQINLTALRSTTLSHNQETRGRKTVRHAVWLKGRVDALHHHFRAGSTETEVLFTYAPHSNSKTLLGDVIVFEGQLPQQLPEHWAAVEEQVNFAPLQMANEWIPGGASHAANSSPRAWWSNALDFQNVIKLLDSQQTQPAPVQIAVIDSGADIQHPALRGVFMFNSKEIAGNLIDDDNNGLVDDVVGYDFVDERPTPLDSFGHGTHVAALLNNSWSHEGVLGGAKNSKLRILRALDSAGKSNSIDLARAIAAAVRGEADIMNCSWGGGPGTQVLRDAFTAARDSGMMIFTSAGNDALNTDIHPQVPKKYPGVIPVGASTPALTRARFSNWGEQSVFMFAPGSDIFSALPEGLYGEKSGTSMASPIAASIGALVLGTVRARHPQWSRAQQREATTDILCRSAEKNRLAASNSKCGSLNALKAIHTALGGEP